MKTTARFRGLAYAVLVALAAGAYAEAATATGELV